MTTITASSVSGASVRVGDAPAGDDVDATRSAVGLGALAAAGSFAPSSFRRLPSVQAASTVALGLIGAGIGYGLATPIDELGTRITGSDDSTLAALGAGGAGLGVWGGTRVWAKLGGSSRFVRPALGSIGALVGLAGLSGAALLTAKRLDGNDGSGFAGAGSAIAGGAAVAGLAVGALALTGRLRGAPTTYQSARRVLEVGDDAVKDLTPEAALGMHKQRIAAAAERYTQTVAGGDAEAWGRIGKVGQNFITGTSTTNEIAQVTGKPAAAQPQRVYVGVQEGATPEAKVALAVQRMRAAGAFERGNILLVAPVATGRFNPLVPMSTEMFTGGDVVTAAIQTSQASPYKALHKLPEAARTHRLLVEAVEAEIKAGGRDTQLLVHGLCYGGWATQAGILKQGIDGAQALGVDHALFLGTPGASVTQRRMVKSVLSGAEPRGLVARSSVEVDEAWKRGERPTVTWVVNDDDPMRMRVVDLIRNPRRVAHDGTRLTFLPVVTAVNEMLDTISDSRRLAGGYAEVGHDYRAGTPRDVRAAFGFEVPDALVESVEHHAALQERIKLRSSGR